MVKKAIQWSALVSACLMAGVYAGQAATPTPTARSSETRPSTQAATGPARGGRGPAAAPANLSGAMSDMNRMLQALKREAVDPALAEQTLHDLATMERDVAVSKLQTPPNVNRMATADEKAKAIASYRSMLSGVTRTLLDIEDAVNDKKPDEIKKLLTSLDEIEKAGHTEFNVKANK